MARNKKIMLTFGRFWESGKSAFGADSGNISSGKDFVAVALMTNIPNYRFAGGIKNIVQRNGKFNCAKV